MDAWSHEPFGNDTACDWAYELEGQRDFSHVARTIQAVLDSGAEYLEDSRATEAVAAAEVLARSLGQSQEFDAWKASIETLQAALRA